MDFLTIPEEVIEGHILPYLKWNDVLRFRRVCKVTKDIATRYMRVHPELAPEIEINEQDKSFRRFVEMNLPTTKIYVKNTTGSDFYEDAERWAEITLFLETFGPFIRSLRTRKYTMYVTGEELDFFNALVNLQSFQVDEYGPGDHTYRMSPEQLDAYGKAKMARAERDPRYRQQLSKPISPRLRNLLVLKIGQKPENDLNESIRYWSRELLAADTSLEHVALPFNTYVSFNFSNSPWLRPEHRDYRMTLGMLFAFIRDAIQKQSVEGKPTLKTFDFAGKQDKAMMSEAQVLWAGSRPFLELSELCVKLGVKLLNVSPLWYVRQAHFPEFNPVEIGTPIVSLLGIHPLPFPVDMPNLERVEIQATSSSSVGKRWRELRPHWPSLKILDVTVDSKHSVHFEVIAIIGEAMQSSYVRTETKSIFQFFFQGVSRPELTELRLNFTEDAGSVAVPKCAEIVGACPNLKKLTIINWPGTNKALLELFGGLPGLEEVSLENCKNVGNVTFVGTDTKDPTFLKLLKLKKLCLKGLDQMPKITDLLFSLVIRHLSLSHFIVTSDRPAKSVTLSGIQSLLEGKFAESIEKFPFQDWSLEGVSTEEFAELEKQFRSYNML